jgi:hypothetical protein
MTSLGTSLGMRLRLGMRMMRLGMRMMMRGGISNLNGSLPLKIKSRT